MTWYAVDPDDITDDPGVIRLSAEAGWLFQLLVYRSLRRGHLVPDPVVYRRLWADAFHDFEEAWTAALAVFQTDADGLLFLPWVDATRDETNSRLQNDRQRQRRARTQKREQAAQEASGHANDPADVTRTSRCYMTGQDRTGQEHIPADKPPVRPKAKKPRAIPDTEHANFIEWWSQAFLRATGSPYGFQGGKDGKHVQRILGRSGGRAEAERRAGILLGCAPDWVAASGVDLGTLDSQWNKLASAGQVGVATGSKQLAARPDGAPDLTYDLYGHKKPRLLL